MSQGVSRAILDRGLTTFALSIGCSRKDVGPISKPPRAKWNPRVWMKVWEMPDGTAQARKRRPKEWMGKFLGRYANETTVFVEPTNLIGDAVAPAIDRRGKYYIFQVQEDLCHKE
jgi:hypothetical protein